MKPVLIAAMLMLAGCATAPDKIVAKTAAPDAYAGKTCEQLGADFVRVSTELDPLYAEQSKARSQDVAGVIVIGLPVGTMIRQDNVEREETIARLKGEREAILAAQKAGGCLPT